jgi:iron complex outermembrane receptor protein
VALLCLALLCVPEGWSAGRNEYLDMDLSELLDVVVLTVAKKKGTLAEIPSAVFVITQDDIKRSGATSIPDALALAPGIHVGRGTSSFRSVSARGFGGYSSNKVLVMIDGRTVFSPGHNGVQWEAQHVMLEDVERIEVVRGPGGTLWGANAVNGVINVITKKAKDTQGTLVRIGTGNQHPLSTAVRQGGQINDTTFLRAYGMHDHFAANTLKDGGLDANDNWYFSQGGFRMDGHPNNDQEWTLQGDAYRVNKEYLFMPMPGWCAENSSKLEGADLLGRFRQEFSGRRALIAQAFYDYRDWREQDDIHVSTYMFDFDLQYETPLGDRHSLVMGTGYRHIDSRYGPSQAWIRGDEKERLYSAFLQDEITLLADTLWLTLGTKYEHNDRTGSEWQPNVRLLWKAAEGHTFWGAVSRTVHTPTAMEQDPEASILVGLLPTTSSGVLPTRLVGNAAFDSDTVLTYEAGYRWMPDANLFVDLSLFYSEYDKLYDFRTDITPTGVDLVFINGVQGESYGLELAVNWKARPWLSFALAYSYMQKDLWSDHPDKTPLPPGYLHASSPAHILSLRSSIDLSDAWQLNFWVRAVDSFECLITSPQPPSTTKVDEYITMDANLLWKPVDGVEVTLGARNLTGGSELEYVSELALPPTGIDRSVYAKLLWRF